jgi:phosphate butyryltransferase
MSKNFDDLLSRLKEVPTKKVAVAVAQDEPVLEAIKEATEKDIAQAILVGDKKQIQEIAKKIDLDLSNYEIMDIADPKKATLEAVKLVSSGHADMLMKGLVDTATFLRSVLNKEVGLRTGKLMSHVAVFDIEGWDKLVFLTDAAFNTYPELKDKVGMINNAVVVAHACGIEVPKVAPICPVEVVNTSMPSTVDAALLAKMSDRGNLRAV